MKAQPITFYLPDTRGVELSRFGRGNRKIGMSVFTYSRIAGKDGGSCPGSTPECEAICYAKRIEGPVRELYALNMNDCVPPIPVEAKLLRIHVSGDFDTLDYIASWYNRLKERPDVTAWAYTRSWRVPALVAALEALRSLPNMQLFASMDPSTEDLPPLGWRRAWIERSFDRTVTSGFHGEYRQGYFFDGSTRNTANMVDGTPSFICPEETGDKADCESCKYCFLGKKNDVTFLEH